MRLEQRLEKLEDARRELRAKTIKQIEEETAYKWAARAIAAYESYEDTGDPSWLKDSEDYYHESIEHAALADHSGRVLSVVRNWIHQTIPHTD